VSTMGGASFSAVGIVDVDDGWGEPLYLEFMGIMGSARRGQRRSGAGRWRSCVSRTEEMTVVAGEAARCQHEVGDNLTTCQR
jgi:hypothetical protein